MELMLTRDMEAFDIDYAVAEFGQPILRYCHALLSDYHEAQDAVQLVFIKANAKAARFKAGSNLSAWLYRIAYNTCMDILRRRKRQQKLADELKEQGARETDSGMSPWLEKALAGLAPKDRALVFSRAVDEMGYDELAEIYGAKEAALRKRYERAKKKLAQLLTEGREGNEKG